MNSTAITDSAGEVSEVKLECHLEVKSEDSCGKTLTFEFSYPDVDPDEISHEFVSLSPLIYEFPCRKSSFAKLPNCFIFSSLGQDKLYQRTT